MTASIKELRAECAKYTLRYDHPIARQLAALTIGRGAVQNFLKSNRPIAFVISTLTHPAAIAALTAIEYEESTVGAVLRHVHLAE